MIIGNMRNIIEFSCHMDCDCEDLNAVFASGRQSMSTVQALSRLVEWRTESREDSYDQEDKLCKALVHCLIVANLYGFECGLHSDTALHVATVYGPWYGYPP